MNNKTDKIAQDSSLSDFFMIIHKITSNPFCHSERSEESESIHLCIQILRRYAPLNDKSGTKKHLGVII